MRARLEIMKPITNLPTPIKSTGTFTIAYTHTKKDKVANRKVKAIWTAMRVMAHLMGTQKHMFTASSDTWEYWGIFSYTDNGLKL